MSNKLINDVKDRILYKLANTAAQRAALNSLPESGRQFHVIADENLDKYIAGGKPEIKSSAQLQMEGNPVSEEDMAGDSPMLDNSRSEKSTDYYAYGRKKTPTTSKIKDLQYNDSPDAIDMEKVKKTVGSGWVNFLEQAGLGKQSPEDDAREMISDAARDKGSGGHATHVYMTEEKPAMQYGSAGVVAKKKQGHESKRKIETILEPEIKNIDGNEVGILPKVEGETFYDPKQLIMRKDKSGAMYSDIEGYRKAKKLKEMGAIPIQSARMYAKLLKSKR